MKSTSVVSILLATVAFAGTATGQTAPAAKPQYGTFGFDTAGMDPKVLPGDDFYDYANGTWEKNAVIPADKAVFSNFDILSDLSQARTRLILDTATKTPGDKIGDFYASFLDEAAADAKGVVPAQPMLDAIYSAKDKAALATEQGALERAGAPGLFTFSIGQDDKAPDRYIANMHQAGLGLPDRDYYLKDDPKLAATRTAYVGYLTKMLVLSGRATAAEAPARAAAVFAFEKALAGAHWTRAESREADKTYNKWTMADFTAKAPGYPWAAYMQAVGVATAPDLLVAQPSAFTGEAKVYADTPLAVLKDHSALLMLSAFSRYLSKPFVDTRFDFYAKTLYGIEEITPRWKRAVNAVSAGMGEAIGQQYVARYFPPATKAAADDLVHNLIVAMGDRLRNLTWMAPETKTKALAKLAAFKPKIGYPDHWRDYSALVIKRDDLLGNVVRANQFEHQRNVNQLGTPMDRSEWFMTPMEINAYANPTMNEVVFPAAILQPPFFDPNADAAVNYGSIGAVIGHEISHHFDDQGRKYDLTGALKDWWTPADVERFKAFTDRLVKQYGAYEPLPGVHIEGDVTLGENIADLAGITVAYDAYHHSLGGKPAPVIDGLTGDQRFFLGFAQVWRDKVRAETLRQLVRTDSHSPDHQRALTVRNLDAWYDAFGAKAGQKIYLSPEDRVRIW